MSRLLNILRSLRFSVCLTPALFRLLAEGHKKDFDIPTHLTTKEKILLYRVARTLPRRSTIVEIGSYLGASSSFLAAAAREREGKVYCVDTWLNEGMTEGPRDTYSTFLKNTERYRDVTVPIRMRSEEAASYGDMQIDMLFVDGDHDFEAVQTDLMAWTPKMRDGAWLVLHDCGWAEGVQRAIKEIVTPIRSSRVTSLPNLFAVRIEPQRLTTESRR